MGDLRVDTAALRAAASALARAAGVAQAVHERGRKLQGLAAATGDGEAARGTADFLRSWSYGMGLIGEDAAALSAVLSTSAAAFETIEAELLATLGGVPPVVGPAAEIPEPTLPASAPPADPGPVRVGVALAAAAGPHQLVPGDPAELESLAATLAGFAVDASAGSAALGKLSLGGWTGKAAEVFAAELDEQPRRLDRAAGAFDAAARALRMYAAVLTRAQATARSAWVQFSDARRQTEAWAAAAAAAPPAAAGTADPGEAALALAESMLAAAREEVAAGARVLATAMEAAREGAPKKPGLFARAVGGLASFGRGFAEGVVGMAEGAAALAELGVKLSPVGMAVDPKGYLRTVEGLAGAVQAVAADPGAALAAVVDLETWRSDPARALGRLAPDLLLALATAGAGGAAARGAKVAKAMDDVADAAGAQRTVLRAVDDLRTPRDAGRGLDCRTTCGDPVDIASGDVVLAAVDVRLDGLLPLVLARTHVSSYRLGRWFGPSWASTLDQRVEVEDDAVYVLGEDGTRLAYPVPADDRPVLPLYGEARALTRVGGGFVSSDRAGRRWVFLPGPDATVAPLAAVLDRGGHRIDVDRTADGTPLRVRHSGGYTVAVETAGRRVTGCHLVTSAGNVPLVRFGYDERGRLAEVVNSSGLPLRYSYDDAGRLTRWEDRNGVAYGYVYDDVGRCVRTAGAGGFLDAEFSYREGLTVVTNSLGQDTRFHLNDAGQVVREVDPLGAVTESGYDDRDRLVVRIDPLGRSTWLDRDGSGNLVAVTRPDGRQTRIAYADTGMPLTVTQVDGTVWAYAYDEAGRPVAVTDPGGAVTAYSYDDRGHLAAVTDADGQVTAVATDAAGLPVAVTPPRAGTTRYERDPFGRVVAVTDPVGGVSRLVWTVEGMLAARLAPDGASESWAYDGEGNLVAHTDPLGQVTRYSYTAFDLPSAKTDPTGARTGYAYDTELRLRSVTDPAGAVWRYERDPVGRVVAETDVNGRRVSYAYNAAGELVSATNGAGQAVSYVRDDLGRAVEARSGEAVTTFAYDPLGRLVAARNADAHLRLERDLLGRVLAETCDGHTLTSAYDRLGRRTRRRTPAGVETAWDHGPLGATAVQVGGHRLAFAYDPAGREVERHLGPAVLAQAWDPAHRLTTQTVAGLPVAVRRVYRYRADGEVTDVVDALTGSRSYDVDPLGRVTAARTPAGPERYTYGPTGTVTEADWPEGASDAVGRGFRVYAGTLPRKAGQVSYDHDAAGRITARRRRTLSGRTDVWTYTWTAEDRLASVTTPDGARWRYAYDPLGRRTAKHRLDAGGAVTETVRFTWDGPVLVEQARSGGEVTTWDYEPGTFRPLAQQVDAEFYAVVTDLIGTPSELIAADGTVTPVNRTTLWGAPLALDEPCPLRFPGQYADPETGLHYNNHRYYDPTTATYLTPDPLGLAAGPDPHAYVPNPTTWTDPLGLQSCTPRLSDPLPRGLPRTFVDAYDDIRAGHGVPQTDSSGQPKIFRGLRQHESRWAGAEEFTVPGAKNPGESRILVRTLPDGRMVMGWTTDHYDTIHAFQAPHFPDAGWG